YFYGKNKPKTIYLNKIDIINPLWNKTERYTWKRRKKNDQISIGLSPLGEAIVTKLHSILESKKQIAWSKYIQDLIAEVQKNPADLLAIIKFNLEKEHKFLTTDIEKKTNIDKKFDKFMISRLIIIDRILNSIKL
ncbi:MAG: hypothetical protein WB392_08210, partial [Methanotrichaceae archaeon]